MSSINQSSSFASSIAGCYRVCCGEAPRRYNSGCGSGDASPNSRLAIDMTDSTDRNKAVSPRMTGNFSPHTSSDRGALDQSDIARLSPRYCLLSGAVPRCRRERSCGTQIAVADALSFAKLASVDAYSRRGRHAKAASLRHPSLKNEDWAAWWPRETRSKHYLARGPQISFRSLSTTSRR